MRGTGKYFPHQSSHPNISVIKSGVYNPQEVGSFKNTLNSGLQGLSIGPKGYLSGNFGPYQGPLATSSVLGGSQEPLQFAKRVSEFGNVNNVVSDHLFVKVLQF